MPIAFWQRMDCDANFWVSIHTYVITVPINKEDTLSVMAVWLSVTSQQTFGCIDIKIDLRLTDTRTFC